MFGVTLQAADDLAGFRQAARRLLAAGIAPSKVGWTSGPDAGLFSDTVPGAEKEVVVPRAFADLAGAVSCFRNDQRWGLLYEALWRIDRGERSFMEQEADPLLHRLQRMAAAVRRDTHRMTAFVRFRTVVDEAGEVFVAWYQPQHYVLHRATGFFVNRFAAMRFAILTPDLCLHWDRVEERFTAGVRREDAPGEDGVETWWRRYYAATFNPARLNTRLLQSHMPKRFWRDLPEAGVIEELVDEAGARTDRMVRNGKDKFTDGKL